MVPYTTAESFNPEDLWAWMASYEEKTGGSVLTLAHNGNMSTGIMFPVEPTRLREGGRGPST